MKAVLVEIRTTVENSYSWSDWELKTNRLSGENVKMNGSNPGKIGGRLTGLALALRQRRRKEKQQAAKRSNEQFNRNTLPALEQSWARRGMKNEQTIEDQVSKPDDDRIRAIHLGHRTWAVEIFDGMLWRCVKAARIPGANAKYRTKAQALDAARGRLPRPVKTKTPRMAHARGSMVDKTKQLTRSRTEDDVDLSWIDKASYFG